MFKFKRNRKNTTPKAQRDEAIVCKVVIYNRAIRARFAEYTFTNADKYLIGAVKAGYPTNQYRIETIYY